MQNSSANKKNARLVAPGTALVAIVAVAVLLLLLHREEKVFEPDANQPDEISANYSELLLQQAPENDSLRLQLIDLYLGLADFAQAREHWKQLKNQSPAVVAFYQFKINAQEALGLAQQVRYPQLHNKLTSLDYKNLTPELQNQLAVLALQLDAAAQAAAIYENLASQADDTERIRYLDLAAHWYLGANKPHKSAQLHSLLASQTQGTMRQVYQRKVVADYLAADDAPAAVAFLQSLLENKPHNLSNEQLGEAVKVALSIEDYEHSLLFNSLLIEQNPNSLEAHLADLKISLAAGNIEHAWASRAWLLDNQSDDVDLYIEMAKLGEWNEDFPEALTLWIKSVEIEYDAQRYEHAWRLAIQLFDFDRSLQLLHPIAEHRQLTDIELEAVFYSHESQGTPTTAEHWLRDYIARYPQHRLARTRLTLNLENTEQPVAEAAAWQAMAQQFKLDPKEMMRWAESHLLNYDVESAWQVLNQFDDSQITNSDYWHLKAAIAWELEKDTELKAIYAQMERGNIMLHRAEIDQLIGIYINSDPEKALDLMLTRWNKWHQQQDLLNAVFLAVELGKWPLLDELISTCDKDPKLRNAAPIILARAAVAEHQLNHQQAEALLKQGITLYPTENLFRDRLLWLYIDTNQREQVKAVLVDWQSIAHNDSRLWLAFAAGNQLINHTRDALQWYQRYIKLKPSDWLAQAAYVDSLEAADYFDAARKQRRHLLETPILQSANEGSYRVWLNLLSANYSQKTANKQALKWQDGSQSLLQLWFEQQLALLNQPQQDSQKTYWLTWAKQRGLVISDFEKVEEAMRTHDLSEVQRLLVSQRMPKEHQVAALHALGYRHRSAALAMTELGDEYTTISREQLRNQALEELKVYPQGAQIGWQQRDFGGVTYTGAKASVARALDDRWYARVNHDQGQVKVKDSGTYTLGKEEYVELALNRQLTNGSLDLSINRSHSDIKSRTGVSVARNWQRTQKNALSVGYDWHKRSEDSGLMFAMGQKNTLWLRSHHQITARDSVTWGVEHNQFETRHGEKLGTGKAFNIQATHSVFFQHPTWLVKAGFDYQSNQLKDKTLTQLPPYPSNNEPLTTDSLLVKDYKFAYVGTSWQRGIPGFLNRTEPQYTWMFDFVVGRQWPDNKITYSWSTGFGSEVFGDDELAFTFGYQSAPKGTTNSQSGGTMGVTYSSRFGR